LIYDVTLPIRSGMADWPGDPQVQIERVYSVAAGDAASVSRLSMGSHCGTHVDAPRHLFPDAPGVDALALDALVGPAYVAHVPSRDLITAADLSALPLPQGCSRLLLRTSNSDRRILHRTAFCQDYVALSEEAARWLAERCFLLVGIDALSIDPFEQAAGKAHRILLLNQVIVVEGLDLEAVPQGNYMLYCLPLKVKDADGSPARVILVSE
jgi:arylformamidase